MWYAHLTVPTATSELDGTTARLHKGAAPDAHRAVRQTVLRVRCPPRAVWSLHLIRLMQGLSTSQPASRPSAELRLVEESADLTTIESTSAEYSTKEHTRIFVAAQKAV